MAVSIKLPSGNTIDYHWIEHSFLSTSQLDLELSLITSYLRRVRDRRYGTSPSLLQLPPELLTHIVQHIARGTNNREDLKACSLVSSTLRPHAQRFIFSKLKLTLGRHSDSFARALRLFEEAPHLIPYFKTLLLTTGDSGKRPWSGRDIIQVLPRHSRGSAISIDEHYEQLDQVLTVVKKIAHIIFEFLPDNMLSYGAPDSKPALPLIAPVLGTLCRQATRVTFHGFFCPADEAVLLFFPNITTLEIDNIRFTEPSESSALGDTSVFKRLQDVDLTLALANYNHSYAPSCGQWLGNLQRVAVPGLRLTLDDQSATADRTILEQHGGIIRRLYHDSGSEAVETSIVLDMMSRGLLNLQHLAFEVANEQTVSHVVNAVMRAAAGVPGLQSLELVFGWPREEVAAAHTLCHIADAIVAARSSPPIVDVAASYRTLSPTFFEDLQAVGFAQTTDGPAAEYPVAYEKHYGSTCWVEVGIAHDPNFTFTRLITVRYRSRIIRPQTVY